MSNHNQSSKWRDAAADLESVKRMKQVGLNSALYPRWFGFIASLWIGGMATATAYDGRAATLAISLLMTGGFIGLGVLRRRAVARVKIDQRAVGFVAVVALTAALLFVGLGGARSFEVYNVSWAPIASGSLAFVLTFVVLEVFRRLKQAKLAKLDA